MSSFTLRPCVWDNESKVVEGSIDDDELRVAHERVQKEMERARVSQRSMERVY